MSKDKVQRIRERGRCSFIVRYGVLAWGIGTSLLVSLITPSIVDVGLSFLQLLSIAAPICCVGGILFGYLMWRNVIAAATDD